MNAAARLDTRVEEGARRLVLRLLDEVVMTAEVMRSGKRTDELLHDLRVALRRLRSAVRFYRPWLEDTISRKLERKIKKVAASTNEARDAEVALRWIDSVSRRLGTKQQLGVTFMRQQLENHNAPFDLASLLDTIDALVAQLALACRHYHLQVQLDRPSAGMTFAQATAQRLLEQVTVCQALLESIVSEEQVEALHAARIELKRLRYALEPLTDVLPSAKKAVERLKAWQDILGELHDAHVFDDVMERALKVAHSNDPYVEHGALALKKRNLDRRQALFAQLRTTVLRNTGASLFGLVRQTAQVLSTSEVKPVKSKRSA